MITRTPFSAITNLIDSLFGTLPWDTRNDNVQITDSVRMLSRQVSIPVSVLLQFAGGSREKIYHYRPIKLPKPNGGTRQIYAPSDLLKALQRKVLQRYLTTLPLHDAATGFRQGLSVADNARRHLGQAVVATCDISDFFDNTSVHRVRQCFQNKGWDGYASAILTGLCTFRGALPQGAPTSPALSNLVNVPLDKELAAFARHSGARYTRYGDDLTFSWSSARRIRLMAQRMLQRDVRRILLNYGYTLNRNKGWQVWRVQRGETPCITGVMLGRDGRLHPQPHIQATMQQLRHQTDDDEAQAQLRGYEGFVDMLEKQ